MFLYIIHIFLFLILYGFIILCDYTSITHLSFDVIWLCILNILVLFVLDSYICFIFIFLFVFCFGLFFCFLTFESRFSFIIIILQYLIIFLFLYTTQILIISILFELFSLLLFLLLLSSRFGYKVLILWYYYMLNLINFILLILLLYYMILNYCYFLNDFCFLVFDEEWLGILCIFYILLILFKLYAAVLIMFMEQLYIRLGVMIYIYMLTFYVLFCFILIIILICFIYFYIIFIKLVIFQCITCVLIGLNSFAIVSLLFILSVNNFSFLFLIFVSTKNYIFYMYLNFHIIYSCSLIILIIIYYFFIIYNIFDFKYNENYFLLNFIFFSFFNNIIISTMLACIFLCIGAIPIVFGFFLKLFCLLLHLSYLGISIIFFSIIWLVVIYIFYFRLIVNIFIFSYQFIGFWVVRLNILHLSNLLFFLCCSFYILFFDIVNLFDLIL